MPNLDIKATKITPKVLFNTEKDIYEIIGRSIPQNSEMFYLEVIEWLKNNLSTDKKISLVIYMDYFNSSSNKHILNIIDLINKTNEGNKIIWKFDEDDEEMKEVGEQIQFLSSAKFDYQEITA